MSSFLYLTIRLAPFTGEYTSISAAWERLILRLEPLTARSGADSCDSKLHITHLVLEQWHGSLKPHDTPENPAKLYYDIVGEARSHIGSIASDY